jgi:hypothetical protein
MMNTEDSNEKIAQHPGLLPYAHTVGGAVIRPDDMGKVKSRSLVAMRQQTDIQLSQLYQQMQLLADQARLISKRVEISERIYSARMSFEPIVGNTYYLYEQQDGQDALSIIAPHEWGRSRPIQKFVASAYLLADHTWDVQFSPENTSSADE